MDPLIELETLKNRVASGGNATQWYPSSWGGQTWPFGYSYKTSRLIGSAAHGDSAAGAMKMLQSTPNNFFPFKVVPVTQGTGGSIQKGAVYDLQNARYLFETGNFVQVTDVTPTSFTFTTMEGHFDGPGQTIKFTTTEHEGGVYLEHEAHASTPGFLNATFAPVGAQNTWDVQAANLAHGLDPTIGEGPQYESVRNAAPSGEPLY